MFLKQQIAGRAPPLHRASALRLRAGRRRLVTALLALAVAACLALLFLRTPAIPAGAANGSFDHYCCGTVVLRDGKMSFKTQASVRYTIGRDERGPYILPSTYVGTWEDRGFQVDGSRPAVKLRLDRIPNPNMIELHDFGRSYRFTRKSFRLRQPMPAAAPSNGP